MTMLKAFYKDLIVILPSLLAMNATVFAVFGLWDWAFFSIGWAIFAELGIITDRIIRPQSFIAKSLDISVSSMNIEVLKDEEDVRRD
jgi:hypothetical protein